MKFIVIIFMIVLFKNMSVKDMFVVLRMLVKLFFGCIVGVSSVSWMYENMMRMSMSVLNVGCLISMNSKCCIGCCGLMKFNDGYIM